MKTLIVEDDFGSRRVLQLMLKEISMVDVVVDGQEAIDAFQLAWSDNEPYDLILLDIMMPNMDGQTALREIRRIERDIGVDERSHVPVVMTTALGDPRNVVEAYHAGEADAYLTKPIEKAALFSTIRELGFSVP